MEPRPHCLLMLCLVVGCQASGGQPRIDLYADSTPSCQPFAECERRCQQGDADACQWAGHQSETGQGVAQDYLVAAGFYRQACDAGRPLACAHLGMMYDIGLAVEEAPSKAVGLYSKACKGGSEWACERRAALLGR